MRPAELASSARGRRLLFASALAAVAVAAIVIAFSHSSAFRVRHVEVTGASTLSRADVVRLAGITPSTNFLWLDAGSIEQRLGSDAWIARAVVSRRLPWTIDIEVVERTAVANVRAGQGYMLVARDGVSLGTVAVAPGLPVIELPEMMGTAPPGGGAASAPAQAIGGLNHDRSIVAGAVVNADGTFSVELDDGTQIAYGEPVQVPAKTGAALRILRWARATGTSLARISVVAADSPAATPA